MWVREITGALAHYVTEGQSNVCDSASFKSQSAIDHLLLCTQTHIATERYSLAAEGGIEGGRDWQQRAPDLSLCRHNHDLCIF